MSTFDNVMFKGTFRDYQQNVLDNAQTHIKDGKIHIVAAPGSGKTILGLELIRRLQRPALILSPSVTIRQQWGERFCTNFVDGEVSDGYVSYDLKNPALLTSVTYQALHSAFTKTIIPGQNTDNDEDIQAENSEDFSNFDLIGQIKACGIGTICLDEAHHLRSEWQKSLEGFIEAVSSSVVVISLTATPPYDSTPNEWKRYISLCGEIDEEIFVPQLVAQKTLCPHQDYIYFNYPTEEETIILNEHKTKAAQCINEIIRGDIFNQVLCSQVLCNYSANEECILDNAKGFIAILALAKSIGVKIPIDLITLVSPSGKLPTYNIELAQTAFQFIVDSPDIFGEELSDRLRKKLSMCGLTENKTVTLCSSEKIDKMLVSSLGKLESIEKIAQSEYSNLGQGLRMLILTDFIKKDMLSVIGSQEKIKSMGCVPIFEILRRSIDPTAKIALLSGGLVILPDEIIPSIEKIAEAEGVPYSPKTIANTDYSIISFSGSNKNRVSIITQAFGQGLINILVGTKSLLGEGWDSPCINSLILASFVGSYMLSNQMRGRAIRIDKANPNKASNIWHLATVEPDFANNTKFIFGNDYMTIERRFSGFLAPAYNRNSIESGIQRIDIINPPFDKAGFDRINSQMLALASDRISMVQKWQESLGGGTKTEVIDVTEVPNEVKPEGYSFKNKLALTFLIISLVVILLSGISVAFLLQLQFKALAAAGLGIGIVILIISVINFMKARHFATPKKTVETIGNAVLRTLYGIGEISSNGASLCVTTESAGTSVSCTLTNATAHEKEIFKTTIQEILSPIDNPRYVLIKSNNGRKIYSQSYACPSIIGAKKENVQLLCSHLSVTMGNIDPVYTRTRNGRADLLNCRKYSYLNKNEINIKGKKAAISQWS